MLRGGVRRWVIKLNRVEWQLWCPRQNHCQAAVVTGAAVGPWAPSSEGRSANGNPHSHEMIDTGYKADPLP